MTARPLGRIGEPGGVEAAAVLAAPDLVVAVVRRGGACTAVGVRLGAGGATPRWRRPLAGDVTHRWAGHPVALNAGAALPATDGAAYLVGARERLLVEARTGRVLHATAADASPTALAALGPTALVVPEGRAVAAYDRATLALAWRRAVPGDLWALGPAGDGLVPLEDEASRRAVLWDTATGVAHDLPGAEPVRGMPLAVADAVVVPRGAGAPRELLALSGTDGSVRWRAALGGDPPAAPPAAGPAPVPFPALVDDDRVVVATAGRTLAAYGVGDGALRAEVPLGSVPTALARTGDLWWVATADAGIAAVSLERAAVAARVALPGGDPAAVLLPEGGGAVAITRLGALFRLRYP